jgi:hypothetical protein
MGLELTYLTMTPETSSTDLRYIKSGLRAETYASILSSYDVFSYLDTDTITDLKSSELRGLKILSL